MNDKNSLYSLKSGYNLESGFLLTSTLECSDNFLEREQADRAGKATQILAESTGWEAENVMAGLRAMSGACAAITVSLGEQKKASERAKEAAFRALIDSLDARIAENRRVIDALGEIRERLATGELSVDDAMENADVRDAIRDWELRTGRKFDPNADDAAAILDVILREQQDAAARQIIADYALREQELERNVERVTDIDQLFNEDSHAALFEAQAFASERARAAATLAQSSDHDTIVSGANTERDGQTDGEILQNGATAAQEEFHINNMFGDGALSDIDGKAGHDFAAASSGKLTSPNPSPEDGFAPPASRFG